MSERRPRTQPGFIPRIPGDRPSPTGPGIVIPRGGARFPPLTPPGPPRSPPQPITPPEGQPPVVERDRGFAPPPAIPVQVERIIQGGRVVGPATSASSSNPVGLGLLLAAVVAGTGYLILRDLQIEADIRKRLEEESREEMERRIRNRIIDFGRVDTIPQPVGDPIPAVETAPAPLPTPGRSQPILDEPFEFEPIFPVQAPSPPQVQPEVEIAPPTLPRPAPTTNPVPTPPIPAPATPPINPVGLPVPPPKVNIGLDPAPWAVPWRLPRPRVRPQPTQLPFRLPDQDTPPEPVRVPPRVQTPPPEPLTLVDVLPVGLPNRTRPPNQRERCRETQKRRRRRNRCNEGFFRELRNGELEKTTWRTRDCITGKEIDLDLPDLIGIENR